MNSTFKYGNIETFKNDLDSLNKVLENQGPSLLIDAIAEFFGNTANKFDFTDSERRRVIEKLSSEFADALIERM